MKKVTLWIKCFLSFNSQGPSTFSRNQFSAKANRFFSELHFFLILLLMQLISNRLKKNFKGFRKKNLCRWLSRKKNFAFPRIDFFSLVIRRRLLTSSKNIEWTRRIWFRKFVQQIQQQQRTIKQTFRP